MKPNSLYVAAVFLTLSALSVGSCRGDQAPEPFVSRGATPVEGLPVLAELGVESEGEEWGKVFHWPLDAVFSGEEIRVLDSSPPWVRVFSKNGRFSKALVGHGEGPGEMKLPYSLRATDDGGSLIAHSGGIEQVDGEGRSVFSAPGDRYWSRGVAEACDGQVFTLSVRPGEVGAPGLLMRIDRVGGQWDTIAVFDTIRLQASLRRRSASFLRGGDRGVLLYPEEMNRHRLVWVDCDGTVFREFPISPLGPPQRTGAPPVGERRPGRFAVKPAEPPFPGGMVEVGGQVIWATLRHEQTEEGVINRETVLTTLGPTPKSLKVEGWYQLFDSDQHGLVLVGNADGELPSVLLVDGKALLEQIEKAGTADVGFDQR